MMSIDSDRKSMVLNCISREVEIHKNRIAIIRLQKEMALAQIQNALHQGTLTAELAANEKLDVITESFCNCALVECELLEKLHQLMDAY